ncbi:MAG: hypothetical protein GX367_02750 [Bacteroidales bacterium]|nr:hypothetical protein [Bacteroidales bacterium]
MSFKYTEIGKMPVEWDVKMIQEIGEVVSGGTPKTKEDSYWNGNISWITPKDLSSFTERFIEVGERSITEAGLKNSSAKLLPIGTVLFSSRAPIGYIAIAKKELCTNQGFKNIICDTRYSSNEFLYYMLKDKKNEIESIAGGSTFKEVSGKVVKEFKIPIPPLNEQKAIAHILSTLDDKIEVNNQINKTLENMAQAIFKQWFVDFEFPNEDGEPYKSSGGEMVESELGMIPKGWEVVKLETVCREITRGFTSKYVEKSRFKNLNQKVNKGEVLEKQYYKFLREDIEIPQNKFVKKYDILLNSLGQGTLGRLHFFIEDEENVVIDQHITIIRADHETSFDSYLYHLLSSSKYTQIFDGLVSGSTGMQMLNISKVRSLTVCMPPVDLQKDFDNRIKTLYKKKEVLLYENEYLKLIRDSLLPKLMSGEIRVPINNN